MASYAIYETLPLKEIMFKTLCSHRGQPHMFSFTYFNVDVVLGPFNSKRQVIRKKKSDTQYSHSVT